MVSPFFHIFLTKFRFRMIKNILVSRCLFEQCFAIIISTFRTCTRNFGNEKEMPWSFAVKEEWTQFKGNDNSKWTSHEFHSTVMDGSIPSYYGSINSLINKVCMHALSPRTDIPKTWRDSALEDMNLLRCWNVSWFTTSLPFFSVRLSNSLKSLITHHGRLNTLLSWSRCF